MYSTQSHNISEFQKIDDIFISDNRVVDEISLITLQLRCEEEIARLLVCINPTGKLNLDEQKWYLSNI